MTSKIANDLNESDSDPHLDDAFGASDDDIVPQASSKSKAKVDWTNISQHVSVHFK
jgi:hypothetical protein